MEQHLGNERKLSYVIYSANESAIGDGAGYWSNEDGWVEEECATLFSATDRVNLNLPISTGGDAHWRPVDGQQGQ